MSNLLTGDELTLNDKEYILSDGKGEDIFLGKLLCREKSYHPYLEQYSQHNAIFEFEKKLSKDTFDTRFFWNSRIFIEAAAAPPLSNAPLAPTIHTG